jgi:ribosome-associated translation inhibitor RaiA
LSGGPTEPALRELRTRLEQEEQAYAEVLAALDALAAFRLPVETAPEAREKLTQLNELWKPPARPQGRGLAGALVRRAWDALAPAVERQTAFDAALVQLLNGRLEAADRLHARLRELASALVRYAQRVQPLVDAGARMSSALATTRSELVLESFGRQLESQARRLDAVTALEQRVAALERQLASLRRP